MSSPCDQLAAYVDHELDHGEADAFELHLASCAACRDALHDALQLAGLEAATRARPAPIVARDIERSAAEPAAPPRSSPAVERARRAWWRRAAPLAVATAAAAAVIAVWWLRRDPGERPAPPVVLATASVRVIEGRISYPAADRHRPYAVARAGSAATPGDAIPLDTLAQLERRGDAHGVAAAYLLMNDPVRAAAHLERATPGADVASDRALLQLSAGRAPDALITLDAALEAAPRHGQALWNRALALRDLGLAFSAAGSFEAVAALGEPGWSAEARARGKALTDQITERKTTFLRLALTDGPRLATSPDAVTAEVARRFPGMTRLLFYDAVRAAASADAVRALAPLAATLDAVHGGRVLTDYVARIAVADFARRGPLAQRYAALVGGAQLDAAGVRDLLAALRAGKQDDILLGAIVWAHRGQVPPELVPELVRLAEATGDPWFHLFGVEQAAIAMIARGEHAAAEVLLLPARARCEAHPIDYRCANLDLVLGQSYVASLRLPDARRVLTEGWVRVQRTGEWYLELRFLPFLVQLETSEDDVAGSTLPLVRAYAGELVHRDPERCDLEVWARVWIAIMFVNRVDLVHAREELARIAPIERRCPAAKPSTSTVFVKAHALRDPRSGSPDEVAALRAQIAALRTDGTIGPGLRAFYDQTEGRLLIDRDRAAATVLLERAIATARTADPGDVEARRARSYAYSILTLDAGRAGEWDRVWKLLGEDAGIAPAPRCTLGATAEDQTSVAVVRDAAGASHGVFDAARPGPAIDAARLVPPPLREALRGCPSVEVLAGPPVHGLPALLPIELAWSYRNGAADRTSPGADEPVPHGPRLVISGTEPPASLGLPRLNPWQSTSRPDVVLDGPSATPTRALAELATASFVEIHAHGIVDAVRSDTSFLMLSPEQDGHYALTGAAIRAQPLRGRPIVILAACHAAVTATYRHEAWNLPAAFVGAGARAVIASTDVIADADAGPFFDDLRARIEHGTPPAVALRDARAAWLASHPGAAWVRSLMVFQ